MSIFKAPVIMSLVSPEFHILWDLAPLVSLVPTCLHGLCVVLVLLPWSVTAYMSRVTCHAVDKRRVDSEDTRDRNVKTAQFEFYAPCEWSMGNLTWVITITVFRRGAVPLRPQEQTYLKITKLGIPSILRRKTSPSAMSFTSTI